MNATNPITQITIGPSRIERALGLVDLAIGMVILAVCVLGIVSAFRPSPPERDNAVFGVIGIALLLPFGLAALAAFDAMTSRAKGRWILQAVTLLPLLVVGCLLLWARLFAHAG